MSKIKRKISRHLRILQPFKVFSDQLRIINFINRLVKGLQTMRGFINQLNMRMFALLDASDKASSLVEKHRGSAARVELYSPDKRVLTEWQTSVEYWKLKQSLTIYEFFNSAVIFNVLSLFLKRKIDFVYPAKRKSILYKKIDCW